MKPIHYDNGTTVVPQGGSKRRWVAPFAYTEDGGETMHLCCDRLLQDVGLPVTEENLRIAADALADTMRECHPGVPIVRDLTLAALG